MNSIITRFRNSLLRLGQLVTGSRSTPLPELPLTQGSALRGWVIHLAAAILPILLLILTPLRTHVATPVLVTIIILAIAVGPLFWFLPSTASALIAIGFTALFSLAQPPSLGWGLLFALIGYLAFRAGLMASQTPRSAKVEASALMQFGFRDLMVMIATALAGGIALLGQRLTGCNFTGASVAEMSDVNAVVQTCHPSGSVFVVLAAAAILLLFLGLAGSLSFRGSR